MEDKDDIGDGKKAIQLLLAKKNNRNLCENNFKREITRIGWDWQKNGRSITKKTFKILFDV